MTHRNHVFISLCQVDEDVKGVETAEEMDESRADSIPTYNVEVLKPVKNDVELNLAMDFEDLKSKLNVMDSKLTEVSFFIVDLTS